MLGGGEAGFGASRTPLNCIERMKVAPRRDSCPPVAAVTISALVIFLPSLLRHSLKSRTGLTQTDS